MATDTAQTLAQLKQSGAQRPRQHCLVVEVVVDVDVDAVVVDDDDGDVSMSSFINGWRKAATRLCLCDVASLIGKSNSETQSVSENRGHSR